ncbi:MAG: CDP-alcohol phosphatidyltransferase family protein [Planctomycetaceae bacterium]
MFDRKLRRIVDPILEQVARPLVAVGLTANAMTVIGFLLGMAGCAVLSQGHYRLGLFFIALNRFADGLDGMMARRTGPTDVGGFLDIVLDMIFYSGVPFAFALAEPATRQWPAMFLIYSFMGTGGSFLAYAAISAKRGQTAQPEEYKSFYFSAGLMEGGETIFFFVLFCLLPHHFGPLAWTFGVLCWLTTLARIGLGVHAFSKPAHFVPESKSVSKTPT